VACKANSFCVFIGSIAKKTTERTSLCAGTWCASWSTQA
jgi:hypothetical protein